MEPSSSSSNAIVLRIRIPKKNQQQQQQKVQDTNLGKTTYSATQQSLMHDCNTRIEPKQYQYHQGQLPQRNDSNPVSPTHASTQFLSIPTPKRQQNPNTWSYPDSLRNKGTPSPTSDSCFMVNEKLLFTGVNSTTPSVPLSRVTSQLDIKIPGPDHLDENGSSGGSQSQSQYKQSAHAWHIVNGLGNDLNEDLENGGIYKMEIVSEEVNVEENGQVRVGFSRQTKMSGLAETMLRNDSKMDVDEIWPTDLANCDTFEDVLMDADIERPNIMRSNSFDSTFSDNSPSPRLMVSHSIDNISTQDPDHEKYPNVSIKYMEFYFDRNSSLSRRFAKESDTDAAMSLDSQISVDKHIEQFLHSDSMSRRKRPLNSYGDKFTLASASPKCLLQPPMVSLLSLPTERFPCLEHHLRRCSETTPIWHVKVNLTRESLESVTPFHSNFRSLMIFESPSPRTLQSTTTVYSYSRKILETKQLVSSLSIGSSPPSSHSNKQRHFYPFTPVSTFLETFLKGLSETVSTSQSPSPSSSLSSSSSSSSSLPSLSSPSRSIHPNTTRTVTESNELVNELLNSITIVQVLEDIDPIWDNWNVSVTCFEFTLAETNKINGVNESKGEIEISRVV